MIGRMLGSESYFRHWLIQTALLIAGAFACHSTWATEPPVLAENAVVGWNGIYKAGCWTTVRVKLSATKGASETGPVQGRVRCVSVDGDNVSVTYDDPQGEFQLRPDTFQEVVLAFQAGGISARTALEFELASGETWKQPLTLPAPLAATQELVVTLGPSVDVEQIPRYIRKREEFAFVPIIIETASEVPDDVQGYSSIDAVVMTLGRESLFDKLSSAQRTALIDYVHSGGRLILTAAIRGKELLGAAGPLAVLAPGQVSDVVRLRRTIGIETAGGAAVDIDTVVAGRAPYVLAYETIVGNVDLWEAEGGANDQPLVVRKTYGFGQVQVIGLDLDKLPWSEWAGRPRFMADLLQDERSQMETQEVGGVRGEVTHLGYEDLTGQLRTSLEQFQQVKFLNFTLVAVIAGLYLVVIGPVDYFFIRRFNLPRHVTWGTLLLVVIAVGGIAWQIADRSHGRRVWINQAEVVDVDLTSGDVRGVAWIHLYSPASRQYDLQWQASARTVSKVNRAWLSWQGLAGQGLGGLSVKSANFRPTVGYTVRPEQTVPKITGLPVPFAGSKALRAQWQGKAEGLELQTLAADPYGQLRGELKNPLPFELTDCRVIFRDHLYKLNKPLKTGGTISFGTMTPLNLQARLTERVVLDQQDRATVWDTSRTDVPRIMEMLMFHEAANGSGYTQLVHRYQANLDFSSLIELQQAVLVGRATELQGELQINNSSADSLENYDQRWTWFRVLIPVQSPQPSEGN